MRRVVLVWCVVGVVAASIGGAGASGRASRAHRPAARGASAQRFAPGFAEAPSAVPDEVVVTYRPAAGARTMALDAGRMAAHVVSTVPSFGIQTIRLASGASVEAAITRLERLPGVVAAEPNYRLHPLGVLPNDTFFDDQWGLVNTGQAHLISDSPPTTAVGTADADVDADAAWATQTGTGAVVAVIDTGVDTDHPDLVNQLTDPSTWHNFASGDSSDPNPGPGPENAHGTHVAGIIAAEQNNGIGVSGVCPDCRVMPIRFKFTISSEVDAIHWAVTHGADVINASYGGGPWSKAERTAIKAAGQDGVLFVAAAGNQATDNDVATFDGSGTMLSPSFPASYELSTILSVAASNHNDQYGYSTGCEAGPSTRAQCSFTSFGHDSVDVAAPGTDIISSVPVGEGTQGPSDEYDVYNGTSMASPMTAGIAGLVAAEHPTFGPVDIKNAIMNGVDMPGGLTQYLRITSCDPCALVSGSFSRTDGRVDAAGALTGDTSNATLKDDGSIAGATSISLKKTGSVDWPNDANDVFKKRLKKGKFYRVKVHASTRPVGLYVWDPTTVDMWQLSAGCLGGSGACPLLGGLFPKGGQTKSAVFKARRAGVYYFVLESFYDTSPVGYTFSIRAA
jgi:subtilisin family serine protease